MATGTTNATNGRIITAEELESKYGVARIQEVRLARVIPAEALRTMRVRRFGRVIRAEELASMRVCRFSVARRFGRVIKAAE